LPHTTPLSLCIALFTHLHTACLSFLHTLSPGFSLHSPPAFYPDQVGCLHCTYLTPHWSLHTLPYHHSLHPCTHHTTPHTLHTGPPPTTTPPTCTSHLPLGSRALPPGVSHTDRWDTHSGRCCLPTCTPCSSTCTTYLLPTRPYSAHLPPTHLPLHPFRSHHHCTYLPADLPAYCPPLPHLGQFYTPLPTLHCTGFWDLHHYTALSCLHTWVSSGSPLCTHCRFLRPRAQEMETVFLGGEKLGEVISHHLGFPPISGSLIPATTAPGRQDIPPFRFSPRPGPVTTLPYHTHFLGPGLPPPSPAISHTFSAHPPCTPLHLHTAPGTHLLHHLPLTGGNPEQPDEWRRRVPVV